MKCKNCKCELVFAKSSFVEGQVQQVRHLRGHSKICDCKKAEPKFDFACKNCGHSITLRPPVNDKGRFYLMHIGKITKTNKSFHKTCLCGCKKPEPLGVVGK